MLPVLLLSASQLLSPIGQVRADDSPTSTTVYLTRDLPIIAQRLGVQDDPAMLSVLDQLLQDYDAAFAERARQYQQATSTAAKTLNGDARSDAFALASAQFRAQQATLVAEFEADVRTLLEEDTADRWEEARRHITPLRLLPRGNLKGSRVDLLHLADGLGLTEAGPASDRLDLWTIDVDEALTDRIGWERIRIDEVLHLVMNGQRLDAAKLLENAYTKHRRVRTINLSAIDDIADTLPEAQAGAWRSAALAAAFPGVFKPDLVDRIFDAVTDAQPPFDAEIVAQVQLLQTQYDDARLPLRIKRIEAILDRQGLDEIRRLKGEEVTFDDASMQTGLKLQALRPEYLKLLRELLSADRCNELTDEVLETSPDLAGQADEIHGDRPGVSSQPDDGPNAGGTPAPDDGPNSGRAKGGRGPGPPIPEPGSGAGQGPGADMPPPDPDDPTPNDPTDTPAPDPPGPPPPPGEPSPRG